MTADPPPISTFAAASAAVRPALETMRGVQAAMGGGTLGWRFELGAGLTASVIAELGGFDLALTPLAPPDFRGSLGKAIGDLEANKGQSQTRTITQYVLSETIDRPSLSHLLDQMLVAAQARPQTGLLRVSALGSEWLGSDLGRSESMPPLLDFLRGGRLTYADQAIFRSGSTQPSRHETLARFHHGADTILPAGQVLTGLEPDAVLVELDRAMLAGAVERLVANPTLQLSINVCRTTLLNTDWTTLLAASVDRHPDALARAVFEVTEWPARAIHTPLATGLAPLAKLGQRLWLDDFGAGLTSFNEAFIPGIAGLKIDRFLHRQCFTDRDTFGVLELVAAFARRQGKTCVIEGVETDQERRFAEACGASHVQGFFSGQV